MIFKKLKRQIDLNLLRLSAHSNAATESPLQILHHEKQDWNEASQVCFFSHFSEDKKVSKDVLNYLSQLNLNGYTVAFCSTSDGINKKSLEALTPLCSLVIVRDNVGFDFGSWKVCWQTLCTEHAQWKKNCQALLFTNDSLLGPIYPLENSFAKVPNIPADFWGLTENPYPKHHLQSYFLLFTQLVVQSEVFNQFMNQIQFFQDKRKVIAEYELELTKILLRAGFRGEPIFKLNQISEQLLDSRGLKDKDVDPTIFFWDVLVEHYKFPFIKRSVVRDNPKQVLSYTDPADLIERLDTKLSIKSLKKTLTEARP